jgi:3-hydroxymyristoyl/3-hydroxydecanoyl-(acyl carrier protein) dehydratase
MKHRCALTIAANHPAFDGHFPGRPILPGVVLLDEAVRAIAAALALEAASLWRVGTVKFLQPALPGDALTLEWEPTAAGELRFTIARAGRPLAKGTLQHTPPTHRHE